MIMPIRKARPSRTTIPAKAHPAAKLVFAEMQRQGVSYDDLEFYSGVLRTTFKSWRTHNKPGLESVSAALGVLGWHYVPVPKIEALPEPLQAELRRLAVEWDRRDITADLVRENIDLPLDTRRRRRWTGALTAEARQEMEAAA